MLRRIDLFWLSFTVVLLLSHTPCYSAQSTSGDNAAPGNGEVKKAESPSRPNLPSISVEQEKEVLAFVSKHDEPLNGLLGNLKKSRPLEYQKALADLFRTTQRISQVKRNRPHAYELEIKKWQAQSKIQVLSAQLSMKPDPKIRANLRQAIEERADLELQVLHADREFAAKRLKQLEEQIALAEANKQNRVQQQFERSLAVSRKARSYKEDSPKKRPLADDPAPKEKQDAPAESLKNKRENR